MTETTKTRKAPAKPRKTAAKKATPVQTEIKAVNVPEDEIRRLAHQYWIDRGHHHGNPEEDWHRAEQELRKRAS
jgi:hypothetical protein